MFKSFKNSEFTIIAFALEKEDEKWRSEHKKKKKMWIHNAWKSRTTEGEFFTLLPHLMDNETKFYEYFRMTQTTFYDLLMELEERLKKQDTFWRLSITPKQRLAVFLR